MEQTRREFMTMCCALGAAGALAALGGGCSLLGLAKEVGSSAPFRLDEEKRVVVDLAQCRDLADVNTSVYLKGTSLGRPIILTHTADDMFHALDSHCMHMGCPVGATSPTLNCPCHGSKYSLAGDVVHGPTKKPLRTFPIQRNDSLLVITVV